MSDTLAFLWFIFCWIGYALYSNHGDKKNKSLLAAMDRYREEWAISILSRENRIIDSQVINGLIRKETFFASTTILILVGVITQLGAHERFLWISREIPMTQPDSGLLWIAKSSLLAIIFIHAFFKFTWSIRQHSYSAILLTSIPQPSSSDPTLSRSTAYKMSRLSSLGARNFNDGIRAYYFALAELGWYLHPIAFVISTTWIVLILYRREFHSRALGLISESSESLRTSSNRY